MMNLVLSIIVLVLIVLAYLTLGVNNAPQSSTKAAPNHTHTKEIRALIAQFEADKAALKQLPAAEQSARVAELEARLYHELQPFITDETRQTRKVASWAYLLIVIVTLSAIGAWYWHGGHFILQWHKLENSMDSALTRSQFLDELPEQMPAEIMSTYCLALQNRIDRQDLNQLDTLAQCVASYGNYPIAEQIYAYIYRKDPTNEDNIIDYAQMSLFNAQGQALDAKLEQALQRIWQQTPDNYMAGVLLASSYTQSGAVEQAASTWHQLVDSMPEDHPLYELVFSTYQRISHADIAPKPTPTTSAEQENKKSDATNALELIVHVTIPAQLLEQLPAQSRLFVLASPPESRMPIVVKRVIPALEQTITLSDRDSMQGQTLRDYESVQLSAIISFDGQANGDNAHTLSKPLALSTSTDTPYELSFDFSDDDAP